MHDFGYLGKNKVQEVLMSKHSHKETVASQSDNRGKPAANNDKNQAEVRADTSGSANSGSTDRDPINQGSADQGQAGPDISDRGPANPGSMDPGVKDQADTNQAESNQKKISPAEFNSMGPEEKNRAFEALLAACEQVSAEYEAKIAELNDQYLRKAADFENFRKRMNREKLEITEFANQNLLMDLITVIDDFERAIKSAETSKDFASFYEGIKMIEKRLTTQSENKWGLKRFDSVGELFDPNRHEALQMEKSVEISEPVVKEEYVKGYFLKERVIRFAKVKVLMPETGGAENKAVSKEQ